VNYVNNSYRITEKKIGYLDNSPPKLPTTNFQLVSFENKDMFLRAMCHDSEDYHYNDGENKENNSLLAN